MAKYRTEDIRNIAVVGHAAAGKTSLVDALLYAAKAVDRRGSVDEGTSVGDVEEDEKKAKYSIDSHVLHCDHHGKRLNLIDTPGKPDFVGQAYAALNAVENAVVVVSAPAGIEVNTRSMFRQAGKLGLARFIVINKMDADNVQFTALLDAIRETFGQACVLFNAPIGEGSGFQGVVGLLQPPSDVPDGCLVDVETARGRLVDAIVEADEAVMERYLEQGELSTEELIAALPKALAEGTVIPILCTSARKDLGVTELLDTLADIALSPIQGRKPNLIEDDQKTPIDPTADGMPIGQVFKIVNDKFVGSLSYIRLYRGKLAGETQLTNVSTGKTARTSGWLEVQGKQTKPASEVIAGDICAVAKVDDLHIGDTISTKTGVGTLERPTFPTPMYGLAVEPKARGDEQKISGSLAKMADEDPTFRVSRDEQTKEMVISGMSQLHLDIIQQRLKRRYDLEIITKEPKIPYRETITAPGEGHHRHKKQTGGAGQFGEVHLRVYPLPKDITTEEECREKFMNKERFPQIREAYCRYDPEYNFAFVDCIVGGSIPNQFIPAVYKGCMEVMERGALAGYRMQDIGVEVFFGKDHPVDSKEVAFKTASRVAFKNAIRTAHAVILEPIVTLEVTIPSKYMGAILGDLNTKRARIESQDSLPGDLQVIRAKVPLAEVTRYAAQLGSITQGQGSYTMEFSHYDQVPGNVQQQIIAKAGKVEAEEEE